MNCVMCTSGFHTSCLGGRCTCRELGHISNVIVDGVAVDKDLDHEEDEDEDWRKANTRSSSRSSKREATLKDSQSTGRKRAARLYPLDFSAPCEWRNKSNCGGGPHPVIGCLAGKQQARHHGPDKSTMNNEEGNVHRICHRCHYTWHRANDNEYDWNDTVVNLHAPRDMTPEEFDTALELQVKFDQAKPLKIKD